MKILNVLVMSVVVLTSFSAEVRADDEKLKFELRAGASGGDLGFAGEVGAKVDAKSIATTFRLNGTAGSDAIRLRGEIDAPRLEIKKTNVRSRLLSPTVTILAVDYGTLELDGQATLSRKSVEAEEVLKTSHVKVATGLGFSLTQVGVINANSDHAGIWNLFARAKVNAAGGVARLGEHDGAAALAGVEVGVDLEHKMLFLTDDAGKWGYGVEGKTSQVFNVLSNSDLEGITSARGRISAIYRTSKDIDISVGPHAAVNDYRFRKSESGETRPSIQAFEVGASVGVGF